MTYATATEAWVTTLAGGGDISGSFQFSKVRWALFW